jgi:hypothetical protein
MQASTGHWREGWGEAGARPTVQSLWMQADPLSSSSAAQWAIRTSLVGRGSHNGMQRHLLEQGHPEQGAEEKASHYVYRVAAKVGATHSCCSILLSW